MELLQPSFTHVFTKNTENTISESETLQPSFAHVFIKADENRGSRKNGAAPKTFGKENHDPPPRVALATRWLQ